VNGRKDGKADMKPEREKTDKRFFDPRPPGPKRKDAKAMCDQFNEEHPVGTPLRVYPMARWLPDCWKETVVKEPGAFVNASGHAVVKVPGDCIHLTHVIVLPTSASQ
jgi:hypothetical protein